jgi:hypothetical protein
VKQLRRRKPKGCQLSLREIAAELESAGHLNERSYSGGVDPAFARAAGFDATAAVSCIVEFFLADRYTLGTMSEIISIPEILDDPQRTKHGQPMCPPRRCGTDLGCRAHRTAAAHDAAVQMIDTSIRARALARRLRC